MLFAEWKIEDALEVRYEEGRDEGIEIGVDKGREERDREVLGLIAKGYTLEDIERELTSTTYQ